MGNHRSYAGLKRPELLRVDNGAFQLFLSDFNEELLVTHFARRHSVDRQAEPNRHQTGKYETSFLDRRYINLLQDIGFGSAGVSPNLYIIVSVRPRRYK